MLRIATTGGGRTLKLTQFTLRVRQLFSVTLDEGIFVSLCVPKPSHCAHFSIGVKHYYNGLQS